MGVQDCLANEGASREIVGRVTTGARACVTTSVSEVAVRSSALVHSSQFAMGRDMAGGLSAEAQ